MIKHINEWTTVNMLNFAVILMVIHLGLPTYLGDSEMCRVDVCV